MLDYLDDIESDFSVFHRESDIYSLHGPLFFSRAYRLAAYQGAIAARMQQAQESNRKKYGSANGERQQVPLSELGKHAGSDLLDVVKVK